jgi:endonuclease YncB( thermonuclease family)
MKYSKLILFIILTLVFSAATFAQRKLGGTVVEVVDGKTVVLEVQAGNRLTFELQYIEIPEPEQQLHQTVREHLQQMVGGKAVECVARGITENRTLGQIFVNGVDVSQQMLRDGAAWHIAPVKSGQAAAEGEVYQNNETLAKMEKRGVWAIENLLPAWEFRAQKQTFKQQQEKVEPEASGNQTQTVVSTSKSRRWTVEEQLKANSKLQIWNDIRSAQTGQAAQATGGETSGGGLLSQYFAAAKIGYTSTPSAFINASAGSSRVKLDHRTFYFYRGEQSSAIEKDVFILGFLTVSPSAKFAKSNSLTIFADRQKFVFAKLERLSGQTINGLMEILLYKVSPAVLKKIADAKNVQIKVGQYSGAMGNDSQVGMKDLLAATN